jgi:uncharacterized membrane-anchored protein YhcB (DUF1043 family)
MEIYVKTVAFVAFFIGYIVGSVTARLTPNP